LREDSTRVVVELAQYVTANARQEAEAIAASGAPEREIAALQEELNARRITIGGGFAVVYDKDQQVLASFQAPAESTPATLIPWPDEREQGKAAMLPGPLLLSLLSAARRNDGPVIKTAGQEFALGIAATASGKTVVVALPMPQGLSQTAARIRTGLASSFASAGRFAPSSSRHCC
jgi:hypothetical protein